ncbi:TPA: hypothetical protein SHW33_003706 [Clostridioides difficile]|uniref:carbamoyltransferase N-terminal domain-containing protein n=3 Tax=Clostridioides difficile TaxID=1496 RepID=UPI0005B53DA0|nr:carbamoyltransferase N-terminal domain-containing protein [Clostridioides difficile]EGT4019439.1 hypothetical protein [Clostridioides difficile]EGT4186480.1 hypothetical protein [Clostridioides difficile]EGT4218127.1 hypothetical protein [Clostridioides difficile]EGT5475261.1 hypothetical protein [Clostridioides difficile]ELX4591760.1 hypothetical protein [Clostridioides difficile]
MKKYNFRKTGKLIMGLNGWFERSHDASAVLIEVTSNNCKILAALEEEKIIGVKCAYDRLPTNAIKDILNMFELHAEDIDYIVFGWNYPNVFSREKKEYTNEFILESLFQKKISKMIPIYFIDHHLAHASACYRTSLYEKAICLVVDGCGESESTSIWKCENNNLELVKKYSIESSFGFLYEAVNICLGFKTNESGKTMGLAAYGEPIFFDKLLKYYNKDLSINREFKRILKKIEKIKDKNDFYDYQSNVIKTWLLIFRKELNISVSKKKINSFYECDKTYKDLSASVQKVLEYKIIKEINYWVEELNLSNLCIAGGVGLNCRMNGKIIKLDSVKNLYIQPAAGDAGVALGSAMELANRKGYFSKIKSLFDPYLGCEYEDYEIEKFLYLNNIEFKKVKSAEKYIAESIAKNKVIALFQGRNEWGPRALGKRSIISSPIKGNADYINLNIKHRELGRPLCPSILLDDTDILLQNFVNESLYMNIAYSVNKNIDGHESIIHYDKSFRPQFVKKGLNNEFYEQLKTIKNVTGSSIIINTSLNDSTPIIYTLEQSLEFFNRINVDSMIFNNRIIVERKEKNVI